MATHRIETRLRIDEKTYEKVIEIAEVNDRSRNYVMEYSIRDGVEKYLKSKRKKKLNLNFDDLILK